eukprot:5304831-Prymnesium_polylepis.1
MVRQSAGDEAKSELVEACTQRTIGRELASTRSAVTISGVVAPILERYGKQRRESREISVTTGTTREAFAPRGVLLSEGQKVKLSSALAPFFSRYDANSDGKLYATDVRALLADLGEVLTPDQARAPHVAAGTGRRWWQLGAAQPASSQMSRQVAAGGGRSRQVAAGRGRSRQVVVGQPVAGLGRTAQVAGRSSGGMGAHSRHPRSGRPLEEDESSPGLARCRRA